MKRESNAFLSLSYCFYRAIFHLLIGQSYSSLSYMRNNSRNAASRRTEFRDFELHSFRAAGSRKAGNNSNLLQCDCNNHTERCQKHMDGGILCIDCFHHTQGIYRMFFYLDPTSTWHPTFILRPIFRSTSFSLHRIMQPHSIAHDLVKT